MAVDDGRPWLAAPAIDIARLVELRRSPFGPWTTPEVGCDEWEAWRRHGFLGVEAVDWRCSLLDVILPGAARGHDGCLRDADFELLVEEAVTWRAHRFEPAEAAHWLVGSTRRNRIGILRFAVEWRALDLAPEIGWTWVHAMARLDSVTVDDVAAIANAGWPASAAHVASLFLEARDGAGPQVSTLPAWAATGLAVEIALTYVRAGLSVSQAPLAERARRDAVAGGALWRPPIDLDLDGVRAAAVNHAIGRALRNGVTPGPWSRHLRPDVRVERTRAASVDGIAGSQWVEGAPRPEPHGGPAWPWTTWVQMTKGYSAHRSCPEEYAIPPEMGFHDRDSEAIYRAVDDFLAVHLDDLEPDEFVEISWPPKPYLCTEGAVYEHDIEFCFEHGEELDESCEECAEVDRDPEQSIEMAVWQWKLAGTVRSTAPDDDGSEEPVRWELDWLTVEVDPREVWYAEESAPAWAWFAVEL